MSLKESFFLNLGKMMELLCLIFFYIFRAESESEAKFYQDPGLNPNSIRIQIWFGFKRYFRIRTRPKVKDPYGFGSVTLDIIVSELLIRRIVRLNIMQ